MKKLRFAGALTGLLLLAGVSTAIAAPAVFSDGDVHAFQGDGPDPADSASAQLVRTANGVNATIHTNNLPPGAYTVWWVVWNDPGVCVGGCDEGDLGAEGNFVGRATGGIVAENGLGNFGASLRVGDISEAFLGLGLTDPLTAEVHMVVRYHGPVVPALMPAQIHSIGGGCTEGTSAGDTAALGDFECFDPQAVQFDNP